MLIRPALVAAAAATLTIVPLTAASAATYRHTDTTQDLVSMDLSSTSPSSSLTPAPDATEPDVKSIRVSHGARQVAVTLQFADLTKTPYLAVYEVEVRTNEKQKRVVDLMAGAGHWRGQTQFTSGTGGTLKCQGLTHAIDYAGNKVTFGIPRACLSNPRWIEVAAMAANEVKTTTTPTDGSAPTTTDTVYFDDSQSRTFGMNESWSLRIRKG
jgi:hypothetical protein